MSTGRARRVRRVLAAGTVAVGVGVVGAVAVGVFAREAWWALLAPPRGEEPAPAEEASPARGAWGYYLDAMRLLPDDLPGAPTLSPEHLRARRDRIVRRVLDAAAEPEIGAPHREQALAAIAAAETERYGRRPIEPTALPRHAAVETRVLTALALELAATAEDAAGRGDAVRFTDAAVALLSLAGHAERRRHPDTILAAARAREDAGRLIAGAVGAAPDAWDDAALRRLLGALAEAGPPLLPETQAELRVLRERLRAMYPRRGCGARLTLPAVRRMSECLDHGGRRRGPARLPRTLPLTTAPLGAQIEAVERVLAEREAMRRIPVWERRRAEAQTSEVLRNDPGRWLPAAEVLGSDPALRAELAAFRCETAAVAVAIEIHRRATGAFPSSLEELAPDLIPRVPRDVFSGEPVRWLPEAGRLYSVGANRSDEGGQRPSHGPQTPEHRCAQPIADPGGERFAGDWVLVEFATGRSGTGPAAGDQAEK